MSVKLLSQIATIASGQSAPQGDDSYGTIGYPFIKAGDLADLIAGKKEIELRRVSDTIAKENRLKLYKSGSVLFAKSGMSCMKGYVYMTQGDCYVVSHLAVITPIECSGSYLKYYFQQNKPNSLVKDEAYPSISLKDIGLMHVRLPSHDEQITIASRIDKVTELIDKRKQQLEKLDELVKSRFVEMFGDPVANEKSWTTISLDDACDGIGDGLHGTPEYDDNGEYPFINGNNLIDGIIEITSATKFVDEATYRKHYIEITENAILISINGTLGKMALYKGEKIMLGKSACYCNLKSSFNREFVYSVMKSDSFAEFLESNSTKSTIKNVGLKTMRKFQLIIPPDELQLRFVEFVRQVDKSKSKVKQALEKLETLKKALMQKYFG